MNASSTLKRVGVYVFLLVIVVSAVRIGDPMAPEPTSPEIDTDDSPEEIAYAATLSTQTDDFVVDYASRVTDESENSTRTDHWRTAYENTDKQALTTYPENDRVDAAFTNPYFRWVEPPVVDREVPGLRLRDRFRQEERLRSCDCVSRVAENETTLVLAVENASTISHVRFGGPQTDWNGTMSLRLYVDTQRRVLDRAVFVYTHPLYSEGEETGDRWIKREVDDYRGWGDTEVRRPDWAGYSGLEFLKDLSNFERRYWIGSEHWGH